MKRFLLFMIVAILLSASLFALGSKEKSTSPSFDIDLVRTRTGAEPDSLDPYKSAASDTEAVMHNVYQGLVNYDKDGAIIPCLASSWEISEDGKVYTFHLRNDVLFHSGAKFTSKDALYCYNLLSGLGGEEALSSKFTLISDISTPDDYTLVLKLNHADASFLQLNRIAIIPEGYKDSETAPVGTGPYRFVSYIPGQKITLERFEDYYDKEKMPQIKKAEFYIISDESAAVTALQSGQLDFANVSAVNAPVLEGAFDIYSYAQNMVCLFALNNSVKPFDDIRVRQALSYAIDKNEIIEGAFGGYGTPLYSAFSPVMAFYYNDKLSSLYPHDEEKAKALLSQAGYANGFELTITVPSNYQPHIDTAQIIAEELKRVGIKAKIELMEWGTWLEEVYSKANYQTTVVGLSGKLDPNDILIRYKSDYRRNFIRYNNSEYDEIITKATTETDENKRAALYKEAQRIISEDAASVWTLDPNLVVAARKELKGYTSYPVTFTDLSALYYDISI